MTDLSRASAPDDGIARRTILAGAAWSIPVIATATVAPAASASGTLALAFNQASYTGTACSTITGAYVTATNGGVPAAGVAVTVTLSGGYTFSGGATSATGLSDGTGRFALPDVTVPAAGGTASMAATDGTTTASASLSAAAVLDGVPMNGGVALTGLPAGVTATQITRENYSGGTAFWVIGSDNKIYGASGGGLTPQFSNAKTGTLYATTGSDAIGWITNAGVPMNGGVALTGLPAGVTATQITRENYSGGTAFWVIGSDNKIYGASGGSLTPQFSNAKTGTLYATTGSDAIGWITNAGVPMNGGVALTGLPAGVTATQITRENYSGGTAFWVIGSDNKIYGASGGNLTPQFSNAKTGTLYATTGSDAIGWITNAGVPMNGGVALTGLPAGVTATQITRENYSGGTAFWVIGSDNKIYGASGGNLTPQFSNAKTGTLYATTGSDAIGWIKQAACS